MTHNLAANALRQQEIRRLSELTVPRLEALRSLTVPALREIVASMLERLGQTLITVAPHIVSLKDGRKFITFCDDPLDPDPVKIPSLRRLHDTIVVANAQQGFLVTARTFSAEAKLYGGPIKLVDGEGLVRLWPRAGREPSC